MTTDELLVVMDGMIVGNLKRLKGEKLRFVYTDEYRNIPNATPISLSMPTQLRSYSDNVISPWLSGLLPDNDAVISRWSREFQVSTSPFSLLSTPIGEDCAGAISFVAPQRVGDFLGSAGKINWLSDAEIAERLRDLREDSTAWLGKTFAGQFSLAGAQAKTAILGQYGRWGVPSGRIPTTHIFKPGIAGFDDHHLNEHLCLDAARRCGLLAAKSRVVRFNDESAIIIDRYDRKTNGSEIVRIHQEDICQARGIPPSRKYQNEGGPAPLDVAKLLRQVMPARIAENAVTQFLDAMIWNWLIAGTDGHGKNYSVLLSRDQVRLAPLYDLASELPYGSHEKKLRMAMKVGGSYFVHTERNTWPGAAKDLGLDIDMVVDRVAHLAQLAPDAFSSAALDGEIMALDRPITARLVDLIADRAHRCQQLVQGTKDPG